MTIKVNVDTISDEEIQKVIEYYNENKPVDEEPLSRLHRYEGGFQIRLPHMSEVMCDANKKIKQLRWHKQCLVAGFYMGFTDSEEQLLYKSLVHVLGESIVTLS
jgi:hypothetical protein